MLRLITDFDGPIVDVSERYYRVYHFCLDRVRRPEQSVRWLSKTEFWALKRSRVPERQIGQISGLDEIQGRTFAQLRRKTVHTLPYLCFDRLMPNARESLHQIQQMNIDLTLMTMRRLHELEHALKQFNLTDMFPEDHRYCRYNRAFKTTDIEEKTLLMQQALLEMPPAAETWMIGDTEADILSAKAHGIPVIGVLCGIRDRDQLMNYEPDWIADNLSEALEIITTKSWLQSPERA
ncbi:MAG TPA: HAD family hydrolase [Elainellaceae cyanobacterium]|jgi:phosphoglycolate phosphatase-like HAD superfamily hydrolase